MSHRIGRRITGVVASFILAIVASSVSLEPADAASRPLCIDKKSTIVSSAKIVKGTNKADVIYLTGTKQTVYGYNGNDTICTSKGTGNASFVIHAGKGNDTVSIVRGTSTVYGDAGNDTVVDSLGDKIAIYGGDGNDLLVGGLDNDTIDGGNGNDRILGDVTMVFDETLTYFGGDDLLTGGAGDDRILGWAGKDTIFAGNGDDTIYGGDDDDEIYDGSGNDFVSGEEGNDFIGAGLGLDMYDGGNGTNTLSYMLNSGDYVACFSAEVYPCLGTSTQFVRPISEQQAALDNDTLSTGTIQFLILGKGNDTIVGSSQSETFYGGAGNDVIYGLGSDDLLGGGAGDDKLYGGDGDDVIFTGIAASPNALSDTSGAIYNNGHDFVDPGIGSNRVYVTSEF